MGVGCMECLVVKEAGNDKWQFHYGGIEGFDYTPGYEYRIEVEIIPDPDPPADAPDRYYKLVRIISKVKKDSKGLPAGIECPY